jgi:Leucine-rich repeat (LRR) protein
MPRPGERCVECERALDGINRKHTKQFLAIWGALSVVAVGVLAVSLPWWWWWQALYRPWGFFALELLLMIGSTVALCSIAAGAATGIRWWRGPRLPTHPDGVAKRWGPVLVVLIPLVMVGSFLFGSLKGAFSDPGPSTEPQNQNRSRLRPTRPPRPKVIPELPIAPLPQPLPPAVAFCGHRLELDATEVTCHRPEVTDLSPLLPLHRLEWVDLRSSGVRDLTPLVHHRRTLWALDLCHTKVRDVGAVGRLERLERLYLRGTPVRDLSPVARCRRLRELDIRETPVRSLRPLSRLTALELLALRDNPVRDLRPLSRLRNLTVLYLNGTEVRDLSPLRRLHHLEVLGLTRTRVRDLSPLARLRRLQIVYLADTRVESLRPLRRHRELRVLGLSGTRVRDLSPVRGMKALETLGIDNEATLVRQARALRRASPKFDVRTDCRGAQNHCCMR